MSIRSKILSGCLALTLLAGLLGGLAQMAEQRLGQLGLDIYDNAFMAVSYLRAAQLEFTQATANGATVPEGTRDDILDNLTVVKERAMSPNGRVQAVALQSLVQAALGGTALNAAATHQADLAFERVVEVFADDGFRYRRRVGLLVVGEEHRNLIAIAGTLLAAIAITALITRMIAPPVRHAVGIAQSIAAGRLDNTIVPQGRGETADLLRALGVMQASIAAALQKIRGLMEAQAASHADEIALRNAQMEAALGNMNQGLCLFDDAGKLLVVNRRFSEMFGKPRIGRHVTEVLRKAGLEALIDATRAGDVAAFSSNLDDGRIIAVSQQTVASGGWVATFEDISERRQAEADLAHMARHDGLTQLPNRLLLSEYLHQLRPRAATEAVAMLCLNLDRFKWANDTLGHPAGDALLCAVGDRLQSCLRETDLLARIGGDEFAIVQPGGLQPASASALADRLIAALVPPFDIDGQKISIGTSIGIAISDSNHAAAGDSLDTLVKSANLAMYRAKSERRGGYNFFEADMDTRLQLRRKLEQDLREALATDQLEVFYQPLVKAGAGISGFEALMRWRHPERGLVNPAIFIPVAEEIGLIGAMGSWILRRACADAANWPVDGLTVAVNLSPLQFRNHALAAEVAEVLRTTGLHPRRLQLEITEGVLLQDDEAVLTALHAIRDLGVRIAMDDFGTGYSSLGYLRRFPFDKLKIDQSFVRHMIEQRDCLSIVRAIIGLGRSLGMEINAEGVETEAQRQALIDEGCGELQGYLFSKPRPAAEVAAMLGAQKSPAPSTQLAAVGDFLVRNLANAPWVDAE